VGKREGNRRGANRTSVGKREGNRRGASRTSVGKREGNRRGANRTLVGKREVNRTPLKPRHSWEYNIKIILKKWDRDIDGIVLAQYKDKWRAFVITEIKLNN
jgi:hypothetical protein